MMNNGTRPRRVAAQIGSFADILRSGAAAVALTAFGVLTAGSASAQTHATPFDVWPQPQIRKTLSVDEAKALVKDRTQTQT